MQTRIAIVTFSLVTTLACNGSPTAPSTSSTSAVRAAVNIPAHHNIPATMEDGSLVWVCETQPRPYTGATGTTFERDHYISRAQCPVVPID